MTNSNYCHKCDTCNQEFATCKGEPIFVSDNVKVQLMAPKGVPLDTVLWCNGYEQKEATNELP